MAPLTRSRARAALRQRLSGERVVGHTRSTTPCKTLLASLQSRVRSILSRELCPYAIGDTLG